MQTLFVIALGGMIGAVSRYLVVTFVHHYFNVVFPWGTVIVNVSGSLLIGIAVELFSAVVISPTWRLFILVGCIGSYTTFSTYSVETVNLMRDGEFQFAILNILLNNIMCLVSVVGGVYLTRVVYKSFV
jgi:fluoride exporter